MRKFLGITLFLLTFAALSSWAQQSTNLTGSALSLNLEQKISEHGFSSTRQELAQTAGSLFAFNILIDFPSFTVEQILESQRYQIYVLITQEDLYQHFTTVLSFLEKIQQSQCQCDITLVCTAGESVNRQFSGGIFGTRVFAESVENPESSCAIILEFGNRNELFTNFKITTPLFLMDRLDKSFKENNRVYFLSHWISSLYRLDLVRENEKASPLISEKIATVKLTVDQQEDLSVLQTFCEKYELNGTQEWDSHYLSLHFPLFMYTLFIPERVFVILTLVMGALSLLVLYSFTFTGKERLQQKKEFRQRWYVIPLTYLFSILGLFLAQKVTLSIPVLHDSSPLFQAGIKIIVSTLFVSIFFVVLQLFHLGAYSIIFGYIVWIIAVINIFLFTAVDLLFFIPMMAEYIVIYISRKSVSFSSLILALFLMLLPFLPYLYVLIDNAYSSSFLQLFYARPLINFLVAFLLFPFQIMWLRMLIRFQSISKRQTKTLKSAVVSNAISVSIALALLTGIIVVLYFTAIRAQVKNARFSPAIVEENQGSLSTSLSKTIFAALTTTHLTIESQEPALSYTVTVTGKKAIPIIDATFDYSSNEANKSVSFNIPPYPPKSITIDFAADETEPFIIEIEAFYETDDETTFRRERKTWSNQ